MMQIMMQTFLCSQCKGGTQVIVDGLCPNCQKANEQKIAPKPLMLPLKKVESAMKNGEIRKLSKANSPLWVEQWAVQGTAKKPYVVSRRKNPAVDYLWSCSCPNWTRHTPRTECKHILSVIVKEKMAIPVSSTMDEATAKEFAAFQKAKATKAANLKEDWGIATWRKFR